ncbi:hypothetical protein GCM10027612_55230 [Microbispora bryophytorum subsp. camponoti]
MNVDVTEVLSLARDLTRRLRTLVGLPEMVVKAAGGLLDRFPMFFAVPGPGPRARRAATADVGVTVDVGRGLFIPVVRDAGNRPLAEIAADLVGFRKTALTGSFRERDLQGAPSRSPCTRTTASCSPSRSSFPARRARCR